MIKKYFIKASTMLSVFLIILSCSSDDDSSTLPVVTSNFTSNFTTVFETEEINFTDESLGDPTSWQWTFEGGNPSSSTDKNPTVLYNQKGIYQVTLIVNNGDSEDEEIKFDFITVEDDLLRGLVGKFDLDGNGDDSSSYQNNGTIIGNVLPSVNRFGMQNSSMLFNDWQGYIDAGDATVLNLTSEMSISVWIKPDGNQFSWDAIVNKWQNTGGGSIGWGYYLGLNPDGLNLRWNVTSQTIEMNSEIPTLEWTHIVVTFDQNYLKLYINGQLENQATTTGPLIETNVPFRIGSQSEYVNGTGGFNGDIDDVYIYNRSLTTVEINELYNN